MPDITVTITGNDVSNVSSETISQPNCDGSAEVDNQILRSRSISYTIETQNGVAVNAKGQIGFAGTDVELGATVASQLGLSYGTVDNISRAITVGAKPGTNMQHTIRQMELWKTGTATVTVGTQQTIIPFRFRDGFDLQLVGSQDLDNCNAAAPTATPVVSVPDALPNPTPTTPAGRTNSCVNLGGLELLSSPWHLEGDNGDAQEYQDVPANALQGKNLLAVTFDLHGLMIREGANKDESAIIFDQPHWFVASLANYAQNGLDGLQTVYIPLSAFVGLPDKPSGTPGGAHLDTTAPVGTLHTRFWSEHQFAIDMTDVCALAAHP